MLRSKVVLFIDGENFLHKIEEVLQIEKQGKEISKVVDLDFNKLFENALKGIDIIHKSILWC